MKRNKVVGAVHITLDTDRLDKNLRNAQKKLDMQVLNDTNEYVPMDVGALRESAYYDIDVTTGKGRVVDLEGLHGYNCRHSHRPWDKSLRNPYIDESGNPKFDVHESQSVYENQQKQRIMERAIRQTKRELLNV